MFAPCNQQYPAHLIACHHCITKLLLHCTHHHHDNVIRSKVDLFSTHINILLNTLMPITMADKLQGYLWLKVRSPCFWLPLSLHSGTHILDNTRGYRLPMPVNGSLCNYDYVQPCAPGTGLNHRTIACFQSRKNTIRHWTTETKHFPSYQSSLIKKSGFGPCRRTEKLCRIITTLSC